MTDQPYSNREIGEMFAAREREDFVRHQIVVEKLDTLQTGVTYTNGDVRSLKEWRQGIVESLKLAAWIAMPVLSILLATFGWLFQKVSNTPDKEETRLIVQQAINTSVPPAMAQVLLPYTKP